jgi:hypothetical protein
MLQKLPVFGAKNISGKSAFVNLNCRIANVPWLPMGQQAAANAFYKYFLEAARDIYPRHGFATMDVEEFGEEIVLS